MKKLTIILGLSVILVHAAGAAKDVRDAVAIPDDVQLIGIVEQGAVKELLGTEELTQWPSRQEIERRLAKEDISERLNASIKPEEEGLVGRATSPREAVYGSWNWLVEFLQPRWIPGDILERLSPLRADKANLSTVICRYTLDGHAIQVIQRKAVAWIVIKPKKKTLKGISTENIGPTIFKMFFTRGEEMAAIAGLELKGIAGGLSLFVPDKTKPFPYRAKRNWWAWQAWYTDGKAAAIFLRKKSDQLKRSPRMEDLWF